MDVTAGAGAEELLTFFATNSSSSRSFAAGRDGAVYVARGLSLALYAPSVVVMLQKLLT